MTTAFLSVALALTCGQVQGRTAKHGLMGHFMDTTLVLTGDQGQRAAKDVVICRSDGEWQRLRETIGVSDEQDKKLKELHGPLGALNWIQDQVVFVRVGQRPTGGFQVALYNVLMNPDHSWQVSVQVTPPDKDLLVTQVVTNPYIVFRMRQVKSEPRLIVRNKK